MRLIIYCAISYAQVSACSSPFISHFALVNLFQVAICLSLLTTSHCRMNNHYRYRFQDRRKGEVVQASVPEHLDHLQLGTR